MLVNIYIFNLKLYFYVCLFLYFLNSFFWFFCICLFSLFLWSLVNFLYCFCLLFYLYAFCDLLCEFSVLYLFIFYVFSIMYSLSKKKKKEVLALLKLSVHSFAYCETFLKVKIDRASFKNFIGSIFSRLRHFAIETQKWFVILELHVKLYKNFKISFP